MGKTYVGSEKAVSFGVSILVVCQKSKVNDWIDHFRQNYSALVFDLTNEKDFAAYMRSLWFSVGVINYELTFRRRDLLKLHDFTLLLDESSMITNPTAKRTKFIHCLTPTNVILLSGTPTGGKYEKLWSQLRLLGWTISKKLFWDHYVITEWIEDGSGYKTEVVKGYKNVDRLKSKLKQYGCVFLKTDEVFDLPEQIRIPVTVPNIPEYGTFMRNSVVVLPDGTELIGDRTLTKRMYARQLCGQYSTAKLDAFRDLVQSTEDRLVVFYNFTAELVELEAIVNGLKRPFSLMNGKVKRLDEYEQYPNSITFVQYQAGAMGLNLQKANKIVYFTLPESSELFEQSAKRIHRIGQKSTCLYYLLMVENSVEQNILQTLKMRKDYDDEIFKKYEEQS